MSGTDIALMAMNLTLGVVFALLIVLAGRSLGRRRSIVLAAVANVTVASAVVLAALLYYRLPGGAWGLNLAIVPLWFISSGWMLMLAIRERRFQAEFQRRMSRALAYARVEHHAERDRHGGAP